MADLAGLAQERKSMSRKVNNSHAGLLKQLLDAPYHHHDDGVPRTPYTRHSTKSALPPNMNFYIFMEWRYLPKFLAPLSLIWGAQVELGRLARRVASGPSSPFIRVREPGRPSTHILLSTHLQSHVGENVHNQGLLLLPPLPFFYGCYI